jgi:hypothetical protein
MVPAPHPTAKINWILGAPRSGTTWLGKIFDSHPDVLYRNEPDKQLGNELPFMCRIEDLEGQRYVARAYLDRLIDIRTLRSAGKLPVFPKNYQTLKAHWLRLGIVYGLHLVNLATRGARWPNNKAIPEVIDRAHQPPPTIVVKSVSACGRARLFLEALPGSRIVFIVRHPCAQVASVLRGIALGRFTIPSRELLNTDQALQLNLTTERFEALTPVEKLAWQWAILNQKTVDDLSGVCGVRIVRYEDLVADPASVVRELFVFAGLTWHPQTAGFILKSTTSNGIDRYYGIKKKSSAMIVKWRRQLSFDDQCRILDIACRVSVGRLFGKFEQENGAILPGWALDGALYTKSPAGEVPMRQKGRG